MSISEGMNEEQIAERFAGDIKKVKTWIETLEQINFITTNSFGELVVTPMGRSHLEEYYPHW